MFAETQSEVIVIIEEKRSNIYERKEGERIFCIHQDDARSWDTLDKEQPMAKPEENDKYD